MLHPIEIRKIAWDASIASKPEGDVIFASIVGSHLWGTATETSDIDVFVCYRSPIKDVLLGRIGKSKQTATSIQDSKLDITYHEVGQVAEQLKKGNPNFLIGVFSPNKVFGIDESYALERMLLHHKNISRNSYKAFKGYAEGHYMRYIDSGKDDSPRRCDKAVKFLGFGISILSGNGPYFGTTIEPTPDSVRLLMTELDVAYEHSPLPEEPVDSEIFDNWVLEKRTGGMWPNRSY